MLRKPKESEYSDEDQWLDACLKKGVCPIESCEKENCNHLVASIDITFAHIDAGSLHDTMFSWLEKKGDYDNAPQRGIQLLIEELEMNCDYYLYSEFLADRPGGDSQDFWAWSENPDEVKKVLDSNS